MRICSEPIIDGLIFEPLHFTNHAIERMEESRLSMGLILKLLRTGKFQIVTKVNAEMWILRFEQIDIVIDTVFNLIKTVVITAYQRKFIQRPTLGDLISEDVKKKLKKDLFVKQSVHEREGYIESFNYLLELKKIN